MEGSGGDISPAEGPLVVAFELGFVSTEQLVEELLSRCDAAILIRHVVGEKDQIVWNLRGGLLRGLGLCQAYIACALGRRPAGLDEQGGQGDG